MEKMLRHTPRASAYLNEKFILIITKYGCPGGGDDYNSPIYFFSADTEDREGLGQAVLAALKASILVASEDFPKVSAVKNQDRYHDFFNEVMEEFSYKTKRALFKKMKYVSMFLKDNYIELHPTRHEKLQAWGREKGDGIEDVIIPLPTPLAEIGQALCLAFQRCK